MDLIQHLPVAAKGVVLVKEPQKKTVFSLPLCEPCIMARTQKQTSRRPVPTGTYPFERVHFDVIILGTKGKKGYDGSTCIPHFWCDHTKYHRAWPLPNHKQAALVPIFESMIAFAIHRFKLDYRLTWDFNIQGPRRQVICHAPHDSALATVKVTLTLYSDYRENKSRNKY
jgi:hypothetical protein